MNSRLWFDVQMKKLTPAEILAANVRALLSSSESGIDTQPKLAKKSGVGQSSISRVMKGETEATTKMIGAIADAYGIHPAKLLMPNLGEQDASGIAEVVNPSWPFETISRKQWESYPIQFRHSIETTIMEEAISYMELIEKHKRGFDEVESPVRKSSNGK